MKQALKIKLANHPEFQQAWNALIKLGYHWGGNCTKPCTAPYLYTYEDGRILADFFDVEGADLSSPNSAFGYFNAHEHKEVTLAELKRTAFEQDYIKRGGDLAHIHWDECDDGRGNYMVNWESFGFNHSTQENDEIYKKAKKVDNAYFKYLKTKKVS